MTIPNKQRYGYSIGHFQNDVCASMWFTYLLIYLKKVIQLSKLEASYLLLIGQLVDGVFTPIVGILSDSVDVPILGRFYSRRKSWHAIGVFLVTISFIFIFTQPIIPPFEVANIITLENFDFYYYILPIAIFQIGWATVQISHLSLIPTLTTNDKERSDLNSKRYSFLILANAFIYVLAIFVFNSSECKYTLTPKNQYQFSTLAYSAIGSGLVMCFLFHFLVKESKISVELEMESQHEETARTAEEEQQILPIDDNYLSPIIETRESCMTNSYSSPDLRVMLDPSQRSQSEKVRSGTNHHLSPVTLRSSAASRTSLHASKKDLSRSVSKEHMTYMINKNVANSIANCTQNMIKNIELDQEKELSSQSNLLITPLDWLKYLPMYSNAIIYMSARLATNCLQIYLTLYISDTIKLKTTYLGILPFIQYFFGFLASIATKLVQKRQSTSLAYIIGCSLVFIGCLSVHLLGNPREKLLIESLSYTSTTLAPTVASLGNSTVLLETASKGPVVDNMPVISIVFILIIFALFGAGSNMVVCSALGLTAELIGDNIKSSAFVYGLMSLGDKIINGVAVIILESINTCPQLANKEVECTKSECNFYGFLISFGIAGILMVGCGFIVIQNCINGNWFGVKKSKK